MPLPVPSWAQLLRLMSTQPASRLHSTRVEARRLLGTHAIADESAHPEGLRLGLDHGHDALLPSWVGRPRVLDGQPIDDLPGRVALNPVDDPATYDDGLERVVHGAPGISRAWGHGAGCVPCACPAR
jgi:hypothetical protein